jgi:hypothetical protein
MKIAIIGCVSKKTNYPNIAYDMYCLSNTFKTQSKLVDAMYDKWFILSVKYGLIPPTQHIEPYNLTLHTKRLTKAKVISDSERSELQNKVNNQIQQWLNEGYTIDFHLSSDYYSLVNDEYKNHSNTQYIKPQKVQSITSQVYKQAFTLFNGSNVDEVIHFINAYKLVKRDRKSESDSWWYHPIEKPFYGKSHELAPLYNLNNGNLFLHYHQDIVQTNHVMGWSNKLENVMRLKLVNGSWRIGNDIVMTQQRLDEIKKGVE